MSHGRRGSADSCANFFLRAEITIERHRHSWTCSNKYNRSRRYGRSRFRSVGRFSKTASSCATSTPEMAWSRPASIFPAFGFIAVSGLGSIISMDSQSTGITPFLTQPSSLLEATLSSSKQILILHSRGSDVLGIGFVITEEEAAELLTSQSEEQRGRTSILERRRNYTPCPIFLRVDGSSSFVTGRLIDPKQLKDYDGPSCSDFPDCLRLVENRVKPFRQRRDEYGKYVMRKPLPERWWVYNCPRMDLYRKICPWVSTRPETSNTHAIVAIPARINLFLCPARFCNRFKYGPLPPASIYISRIMGKALCFKHEKRHEVCLGQIVLKLSHSAGSRICTLGVLARINTNHRSYVMRNRGEGLTKTYNRFHAPDEAAADIQTAS